jgi:hypothetical protein
LYDVDNVPRGGPGHRAESIDQLAGRCSSLKRVEVDEEIVELLLGERGADGGHHVAAAEDGLAHESFVRGQTARQEWFFEETLQAGAVLSGDRVGVVAGGASLLIQMATRGLLGVQAEFGVGFSGGVVAAAGEESHKRDGGDGDCDAVHGAIIF